MSVDSFAKVLSAAQSDQPTQFPQFCQHLKQQVQQALQIDIGSGDITAALITDKVMARATVMTREDAVICGVACVEAVFQQLDPSIKIIKHCNDGDEIQQGQVLVELIGPACALLTGERVALNFLQTLSGTATTTRHYVNLIRHTQTVILDTRKTIPGFRYLQKYAVLCGGAQNHRFGLYDAFLIKENHIVACGSIANAVNRARALYPERLIEVEVESLDELQQALDLKVERIMLDNFDLEMTAQAVELNRLNTKLEVSGNVSELDLVAYAETGVDYISIGALTKHLQAIDFSMRITL